MPATRATASTSPLLTALLATLAVVSAAMKTLQRAMGRPEALAADLAHRPGRPHEVDLADVVARPFGAHRAPDRHSKICVARPRTEQRPQVELIDGELARAERP